MFEQLLGFGRKPVTGSVWSKRVATGVSIETSKQATATYKTDVYFIGGNGPDGTSASNKCYKYNVVTNAITAIADMPTAMFRHSCIAGDGVIFVWGGFDGATNTQRFYRYTVSNNTWVSLTQPTAAQAPGIADVGMCNIGLDLYFLGGSGGNAPADSTNRFIKYTPSTNTWKALAAYPTAISSAALAVTSDRVYAAFGAYNQGAVNSNIIAEYDEPLNTWTTVVLDTVGNGGVTRVSPNVAKFGTELHYWDSVNGTMSKYKPESKTYTADAGAVPAEYRAGRGFVIRNKWVGGITGLDLTVYDPYFGKPLPDYVVIPFQEFGSTQEVSTGFNIGGAGTIAYPAMNWFVVRFNSETWVLAEKPLRRGGIYNNSYAFLANGANIVYSGINYNIRFTATPLSSNEPWGYLFSRTVLGYNPTGITYTKLANHTNYSIGFRAGAAASYEWTAQSNGSSQNARGGTDVGSPGASFGQQQDSQETTCRPFARVTGGAFPW